MMYVHEDALPKYPEEQYLRVGETRINGSTAVRYMLWRRDLMPRICGAECSESTLKRHDRQETRYGICWLPAGHKRGHTNVAYFCDDCHKARRGQPHLNDPDVTLCFPCAKQWERDEDYRRAAMEDAW